MQRGYSDGHGIPGSRIFIVNAPFIFPLFWQLVRPWLRAHLQVCSVVYCIHTILTHLQVCSVAYCIHTILTHLQVCSVVYCIHTILTHLQVCSVVYCIHTILTHLQVCSAIYCIHTILTHLQVCSVVYCIHTILTHLQELVVVTAEGDYTALHERVHDPAQLPVPLGGALPVLALEDQEYATLLG
jgi:hypothetical protein